MTDDEPTQPAPLDAASVEDAPIDASPTHDVAPTELSRLLAIARSDPGLDPGALDRVIERAASSPPGPMLPKSAFVGGIALIAVILATIAWRGSIAIDAPASGPIDVSPRSVVPIPTTSPVSEPPPIVVAPAETDSARDLPSVAPASADPGRPERAARAHAPERSEEALPEGTLLLRARRALPSDPASALALTEAHRDAYPEGAMSEEREVLAIEALAALGRADAARARAQRFERASPGSPYLARVRGALTRRPGDVDESNESAEHP